MTTDDTDEGSGSGVDALVLLERVGLRELATTQFTAVLPRTGVNQLMTTHVTRAREELTYDNIHLTTINQ